MRAPLCECSVFQRLCQVLPDFPNHFYWEKSLQTTKFYANKVFFTDFTLYFLSFSCIAKKKKKEKDFKSS